MLSGPFLKSLVLLKEEEKVVEMEDGASTMVASGSSRLTGRERCGEERHIMVAEYSNLEDVNVLRNVGIILLA
jgi:hypothetical protein